MEIGGTTAIEFHCSGSCPTCRTSVEKLGKGLKLAISGTAGTEMLVSCGVSAGVAVSESDVFFGD